MPLTVPLDDRFVNAPAAADVPPIAGGDARYVLKPDPLTVELAESVVNAPLPGVVAPVLVGLMTELVAKTAAPEPVSSLMTPASCAEVVAAN
ncbi:protein of unknown function [Pararobbsia alpina]